jgi:predicted MarR family transcription regulator
MRKMPLRGWKNDLTAVWVRLGAFHVLACLHVRCMVVADVDAASQDANLISHIVGVVRDFEDLCDLASTFMNNPASTGPGLDDNLFW